MPSCSAGGRDHSIGEQQAHLHYLAKARRRLRSAFPRLPDRRQCNRLVRRQGAALTAFFCPLAESFVALRAHEALRSHHGSREAAGRPAEGPYLADSGSVGSAPAAHWRACYAAPVLAPPQRNPQLRGWTPEVRRRASGLRQIVETAFARLFHTLRLETERPHAPQGFQMRLAAGMALSHFCIWLDRQLGRSSLAFADLIAW